MTALLSDITQLEKFVTRHFGIEIGFHERVVDVGSPTHEVINGTLRTIGIIYLYTIALFHQIVTHGTKAVGGLTGEQCDGFFLAIHARPDKIVGTIIANFQDDIRDCLGQIHKLAEIVG